MQTVRTHSNHDMPLSPPNGLNREFTVSEPDKVWVGDITYIATDEDGLFLAVVIDLFSPRVMSWSLKEHMTREIVMDALRMAGFRRRPDHQSGLTFPSDRVSPIRRRQIKKTAQGLGITTSVSHRGDCWDCACRETLVGSLKVERLHGQRLETLRLAKYETLAWLLWYNGTRMQSTLDDVTPMQFEAKGLASRPKRANA